MICSSDYTRRGFLKAMGAGTAVLASAGNLMAGEQKALDCLSDLQQLSSAYSPFC